MLHSIRDCKFYFKRYPFRGLSVSKADQLRNSCEMYFDRIAQFRDRLKSTLNAMQKAAPPQSIPTGKIIMAFNKTFDWEMRQRNHVHHSGRYDDTTLSKLSIAELLQLSKEERMSSILDINQIYRQATSEWQQRISTRTKQVNTFLELTAKLLMERCSLMSTYELPAKKNDGA